MKSAPIATLLIVLLSPWIGAANPPAGQASSNPSLTLSADVVIAGGSTAALAAAFAAAEQGASTILIEPTDWIGGQFTSSGVPPVDEAWHKIRNPDTGAIILDVARIARDPRNMPPALRDILMAIGNPGRGWVSRFCFEPKTILQEYLEPWQRRLSDKLTVIHNSVIKRVETGPRRLASLTAIRRFPKELSFNGYDRLPSEDLADWYCETPSNRFDKQVVRITGKVFVEATEWGELLALSGADYLQGVDQSDGSIDTDQNAHDSCGQSIVFGFAQRLNKSATPDTAIPATAKGMGLGKYQGRVDAWEKIWTYRRIRGQGDGPSVGDLSLQNWGYEPGPANGGNDYPFGYLFQSKSSSASTRQNWQGGIRLDVLRGAEQRALAWHHWFKNAAPPKVGAERITLAKNIMGTGHGLSKLPYIRDTRRSIGLDNFVLTLDDLVGDANANTGTFFRRSGCYRCLSSRCAFLDNVHIPHAHHRAPRYETILYSAPSADASRL